MIEHFFMGNVFLGLQFVWFHVSTLNILFMKPLTIFKKGVFSPRLITVSCDIKKKEGRFCALKFHEENNQ